MTREGSSTVYKYVIVPGDMETFSFRLGVKDWETTGISNNQMQPYTNDDLLTVTDEGASTTPYIITEKCYYGNVNNNVSSIGKAWKVSFTKNTYSKLTVYVDVNDANRKVWVEGTKSSVSQKPFRLLKNSQAVS